MGSARPLDEAIRARVAGLIAPMLAARRVEPVELTYRRAGPQAVLRLLVDTAAGITVQACTELSRAIGAVLDEHDAIPERYVLEVASPGLDRPLRSGRDFERVIGRRVALQLSEPVAGLRELAGTVVSVGDALVTVRLDRGDALRVPLRAITTARQDITFHKSD